MTLILFQSHANKETLFRILVRILVQKISQYILVKKIISNADKTNKPTVITNSCHALCHMSKASDFFYINNGAIIIGAIQIIPQQNLLQTQYCLSASNAEFLLLLLSRSFLFLTCLLLLFNSFSLFLYVFFLIQTFSHNLHPITQIY